jgi:CheY-like chemotaxis protein
MATILVADDDRLVSQLVSATLRRSGFTVVQAFDAMQAVMFALRAPHPDAIVLDIHMPGGTGIQALQKIRRSAHTAAIPVVVLSGTASETERADVESYGVAASLFKPVDPDALLEAVQRALGAT